MLTDNCVCVVTWADEVGGCPADYVLKWANSFEAFVVKHEKVDGVDQLDSISLGQYPNEGLALEAIYAWNDLDKIGPDRSQGFGFVYINKPH